MERFSASHSEKVVSTLATLTQGATMKKFRLFSVVLTISLLCVISVHSLPENTEGQSAADAEKEAWKKVKEQTAEFLAHEREYVMSLRKPIEMSTVSGQAAVVEKTAAVVNSAPVAAAPDSAATGTTLPPVTTAAPTNSSSTSVGNTADLPQTTTSVPA